MICSVTCRDPVEMRPSISSKIAPRKCGCCRRHRLMAGPALVAGRHSTEGRANSGATPYAAIHVFPTCRNECSSTRSGTRELLGTSVICRNAESVPENRYERFRFFRFRAQAGRRAQLIEGGGGASIAFVLAEYGRVERLLRCLSTSASSSTRVTWQGSSAYGFGEIVGCRSPDGRMVLLAAFGFPTQTSICARHGFGRRSRRSPGSGSCAVFVDVARTTAAHRRPRFASLVYFSCDNPSKYGLRP